MENTPGGRIQESGLHKEMCIPRQNLGITAGNTAATIVISETGSGGTKMEFRKIKIADLIPAAYNPRKKLKPGDKEYEKIKNSIKEFGYVEPVIVLSADIRG